MDDSDEHDDNETNLDGLIPDLEALYKDVHAHPALVHAGDSSSQFGRERLRASGYDVTTRVGKSGAVGLLATIARP